MEGGTDHKAWEACADNAYTDLRNRHKPRQQQIVGQVDTILKIEGNQ